MSDAADAARRRGAAYGLLAAATFGAGAPVAKQLVPTTSPLILAGLLYLAAGLALTLWLAVRPGGGAEPRLRRADLPLLAGIVVSGGMLGPALLLSGLTRLSAVAASLLLNLEAPFTIGFALLLFREHLSRAELGAAACIVLGGVVLGLAPATVGGDAAGVLAVAAACACWGLDNNLTQRLSHRDPVHLVRLKALSAGAGNLALGLATGGAFPPAAHLLPAAVLGVVSYGLSIVLDVRALRLLGAAREAALFATAPFLGAAVGALVFGESFGAREAASAGVMALGVALLVRARHGHRHTHEPVLHEHLHVHDEHHRHAHDGVVVEPHSHPHVHQPLTHDHPHVSDLHHRHEHR